MLLPKRSDAYLDITELMIKEANEKKEGKKEESNIIPFPEKADIGEASDLSSYEELAKDIGFEPPQLLENEVVAFLKAEGFTIYVPEDVFNYMTEKAAKKDKEWEWVPLREVDKSCDQIRFRRISKGKGKGNSWSGGYDPTDDPRTYNKAIPERVLHDVKKLNDRFGAKVGFLVSDYRVPNPDPFIAVMTKSPSGPNTMWIFGVWNEPGFTD